MLTDIISRLRLVILRQNNAVPFLYLAANRNGKGFELGVQHTFHAGIKVIHIAM